MNNGKSNSLCPEKVRRSPLRTGLCLLALVLLFSVKAQKTMEALDRGVVAVRTSSNQVYIGWRMLGTDPSGIGFNVYRGATKINSAPVTSSTNYVDNTSANSTYHVRPVLNGVEQAPSEQAGVWSQQYLNVSLQRPAGGSVNGSSYTYSPNDCSVGDLDGDGSYEIVVKWYPSNAKDNSQSGYTGNTILDAYELNGTRMWRINLGHNIRSGAHYTQFIVYDLDSDGDAEVVCKTADGTVDGQGTVIGDPNADYRNSGGYVLDGPEYLTVFSGASGRALETASYVPPRGNVSGWGDNYGNRVDRFLAGVAYLDGSRPSVIMCRGYYTRSVIAAWDYRGGNFTQRWVFDTNNGYSSYENQGAHSLSIGDVDNDGRDEIMYGACAINDNGQPMYNTQFNHGDATHLGDFLPNRPGLEFYMPSESAGSSGDGVTNPGVHVRDAGSGQVIWSKAANGDIGRAMTADITSSHFGNEFWAAGGLGVYNSSGQVISGSFPPINFAVWWDGDPLREMLDGTTISKWGNGTLLSPGGVASNNGSKANPCLSADILGDWREEVIWRDQNNAALRIYTTTIPTSIRIYTLMHDPQYRVAIAWQNVAYNQPPHPGFFIGDGMSAPPQPDIQLVGDTDPPDPPNGIISGATYIVTNRNSGQVMDVTGVSQADGATVIQWPLTGNANQQWIVQDVGNNFYSLTAVHSGKSLDVYNISTADGADVVQWPYWGGEGQQFQLQSTGDGYYTIVARHSGKCVEVINASTENGANVQQWTCNGHPTQSWQFTQISGARTGATGTTGEWKEHENEDHIRIHPNPGNEHLVIQMPGAAAGPCTLSLFSVSGQLVRTTEFSGSRYMLDIRSLKPEVYIIRLESAGGTTTHRFIKQ